MQEAVITTQLIEQAMTYEAYLELVDQLLAENRTTGSDQSEQMVQYTRLNRRRMARIHQIGKIQAELALTLRHLQTPWIWLILTEPWCGDAAQNIPFLYLMSQESSSIRLCLLLRDEHPSVMDAFLTNGSRAIPKLICLRAHDLKVLGTWGPRPLPAQQMVWAYKSNPTEDFWQFAERLHKWYADDKDWHLQQELKQLIELWQKTKDEC